MPVIFDPTATIGDNPAAAQAAAPAGGGGTATALSGEQGTRIKIGAAV